jgi:septal ring factor EnvC (AmiA/AmiB activator)
MANPQLQRLADSAGLKVASYLINVVVLPMACYAAVRVFNQLDSLQALVARYETSNAVLDQRVQALERLVPDRTTHLQRIDDTLMRHELELQQLKDRR